MRMAKKDKPKEKMRVVNFDFYEMYVINKKGNTIVPYNLSELFKHIKGLSLDEKTVSFQEEQVRMNNIQVDVSAPYELIQFNICRLRDDAPGITSTISSELSNIPLEENEYIAEDINGLYDSEKRILMLQRNIRSLSPTGLQVYFQVFLDKLIPNNDHLINFQPIMDIDSIKKAKRKKVYRKLSLRVANNHISKLVENKVGKAFKELEGLEGASIEIIISSDKQKKSKLKTKEVKGLIETIENDKELFLKAEISGKENDEAPIEKFDLLHGKLREKRRYNVPPKTYLNPDAVLDDITPAYISNIRKRIIDNLSKK